MAQDAAADGIPLEEIASLPEFYHPRIGPNGDRLAYYWDGSGRNELVIQDLDTGEERQVSDGEVPRDARYPIMWHPDGDRIFFHQDEGGDEQNDIHVFSLSTETAQPVVETDGQTILTDVQPDGNAILLVSTHAGQLNVHEYDLQAEEFRQLTEFEQPIRWATYGPEGDRIAFFGNETDDLENRDAYIQTLNSGDRRRLPIGDEGAETRAVGWHPDGDRLLIADNSPDLGRAGVFDLDNETVTWYGDETVEEQPTTFTPDGSGFIGLRNEAGTVTPVLYGLDGSERRFDVPDGVASVPGDDIEASFLDDGRVLLSQATADTRESLFAYDIETGSRDSLRKPEYGDLDPKTFSDAEYVEYESTDGTDIGAILYRAETAGDSPVIVQVHGGPHGQSLKSFSAFTQFLVSRGYSVLQPNYRGSTGRGREFKNAVHGDWGGKEQEDIAAGARWLSEQSWVDADRIAVAGGSYGGYSAYCQLTMHPEEWAAGVARVGMTDLHSLFEESMPHFKTTLREQMGDPEENADLWRERSPLTHVENVSAPLLIAHGVNDPRVPISQARQFRDALEEHGYTEGEDFVYEELGEEGHGSTDIEQKIRAFRLMADFFDDHL